MLLGGKGGCQQCACLPNPCLECRQYTADTYYNSATVSVTINGNSVPVWNGVSPSTPSSFLYLTPSGFMQASCFLPADTPKRVRFYAYYEPVGMVETYDNNGCDTYRAHVEIVAFMPESSYFENGWTCKPTYIMGNCDDIGGIATPQSWYFSGDYVTEDCLIDALDWLNSLTVVTTFAWDACECPP